MYEVDILYKHLKFWFKILSFCKNLQQTDNSPEIYEREITPILYYHKLDTSSLPDVIGGKKIHPFGKTAFDL